MRSCLDAKNPQQLFPSLSSMCVFGIFFAVLSALWERRNRWRLGAAAVALAGSFFFSFFFYWIIVLGGILDIWVWYLNSPLGRCDGVRGR